MSEEKRKAELRRLEKSHSYNIFSMLRGREPLGSEYLEPCYPTHLVVKIARKRGEIPKWR